MATIRCPLGWCAAGAIDTGQLTAVPDQSERVAAKSVAGGLHHGQRNGRGQGRIDGIAALQQHAQAGLGCQGLRGGDGAASHDRHALGGVGVMPEVGDAVIHIELRVRV